MQAGVWLFAFVGGFYRTFVLQSLWNWFVVGALGMPSVSYLQMYGLNLIVQLIFERSTFEEQHQWDTYAVLWTASVPEEKRAQVAEELEARKDRMWIEVRTMMITSFVSNTTTLAVGWFVHTLAV